jgi:hypothetical protein
VDDLVVVAQARVGLEVEAPRPVAPRAPVVPRRLDELAPPSG